MYDLHNVPLQEHDSRTRMMTVIDACSVRTSGLTYLNRGYTCVRGKVNARYVLYC